MSRDADHVVRLTPDVKRRLTSQWRRLQADLDRAVSYSEMIDAINDQIVYEDLLTSMRAADYERQEELWSKKKA